MNRKSEIVVIVVDGEMISTESGLTLLEVLKKNRFDVPSACTLKKGGNSIKCNLCLVQIKGIDEPCLSCETKVRDGMILTTASISLLNQRRANLETLFSKHYSKEQCDNCIWDHGCELHKMASKLELEISGR